ncbi:MAG: ATP-dependent Clp protease ATP-binding subunit [Alistipes sp.]|nr:ATP-dependent Clp protease ATP-binding subunit [Alistipes sp.]
MKNKISKSLDAAFARVTFDLTKSDIHHSYKDFLTLEILREETSSAYHVLAERLKDWELKQLVQRIRTLIDTQPHKEQTSAEQFMHTFRGALLDEISDRGVISSAHLLKEIAADTTTATSQVLALYGITSQTIDAAIEQAQYSNDGEKSEIQFNIFRTFDIDDAREKDADHNRLIEKFGIDLTRMARKGEIDPVIGRNREIERVIQILSRRKKNNPILIGEAGVGKSAIVEGLALRIASRDVPYPMQNKRIIALDVNSLIAGTKFRGEFEERMQQLLEELRGSTDTIVFIDEIHTIVGAGATQGSLDTANILKPALARGELQTIGATTLDEFRENIESDAALERRFQKVIIEPTSAEQTLNILRNIAPHYEQYHNVTYTEEALHTCVMLTERYITDRHFPDKAIDVLDEAGACSHIDSSQEPSDIAQTERLLTEVRKERREAVAALVYEKAATARLKEIALKSKLDEQRTAWQRKQKMNPTPITGKDIERVITSITGIPAERLSRSEAERLQTLSSHLQSRVIGQQEAVERITRSLQRHRAGLKENHRPIGVFLFVGPTGVGKTLLAKELSKWMFDQNRGLIRIDMSEYGEKHNTSRLIGSPPGYVGYGEGGQLTEAVRRQPYSVVLFDEVEKAHPEVFNTMLQIFDEGHLTDGAGRRVDFRNTIIILTSNVGSRAATERVSMVGFNTSTKETLRSGTPSGEYRKALERTFAPEFLNRIDDIIYFRELTQDDVESIIDLELQNLFSRAKQLGYTLEVQPDARRHLAHLGYEARYGARALRRTLLDKVEEPLSALIVDGKLHIGGKVLIEALNDDITLRVA